MMAWSMLLASIIMPIFVKVYFAHFTVGGMHLFSVLKGKGISQ